jgi:hypothetical protein
MNSVPMQSEPFGFPIVDQVQIYICGGMGELRQQRGGRGILQMGYCRAMVMAGNNCRVIASCSLNIHNEPFQRLVAEIGI